MTENRSLDDFFDPDDTGDDAGSETNPDETAANAHAGEAESDAAVGETDSAVDTEEAEPDADSAAPVADTEHRDSPDDDSEAVTIETETDGSSSVTPSRATFRWTPGGDDCPSCGRSVERRWRDGDRFVCTDCKAW